MPLTYYNVVGELKCELGGIYLPYVKCLNTVCGVVNCVPYGKTHRMKETVWDALLLICSLEQVCDGFYFY